VYFKTKLKLMGIELRYFSGLAHKASLVRMAAVSSMRWSLMNDSLLTSKLRRNRWLRPEKTTDN